MESGQLTPEMLKVLRGESTGDEARDKEIEAQLSQLLDRIGNSLAHRAQAMKWVHPRQPLLISPTSRR